MKFTKMVRIITVITLLTASIMNAYIQYRTNESYNKLRISINDLKSRMYELRALTNSISRNIHANKPEPLPVDGMCTNSQICDAKYTVINKNGVLGIFNAEDQLVGKRTIESELSENQIQKLKEGIKVMGECELDSLLHSLGCEEEKAQI